MLENQVNEIVSAMRRNGIAFITAHYSGRDGYEEDVEIAFYKAKKVLVRTPQNLMLDGRDTASLVTTLLRDVLRHHGYSLYYKEDGGSGEMTLDSTGSLSLRHSHRVVRHSQKKHTHKFDAPIP